MANEEGGKDAADTALHMEMAKKIQAQEDADMDKVDADVAEDKGKPVTSYIKSNLATQLTEMGFSQHASEKALFMVMSKGQTIENATEWLYEHIDDADINEQLFIVG